MEIPRPVYLDFLNTPQSGTAHRSLGISTRTFVSSLIASILCTAVQTLVFCYLRPKLKTIYQPRCYYVEEGHRVEPLPSKFFGWIAPLWNLSINDYYPMGLDAYFFLRYICVLITLFSGLALVNIPVLIPVNLTGGSQNVFGLDRLTTSNISPHASDRYLAHFFVCVTNVIWLHFLIVYELNNFTKIRNKSLVKMHQDDQDTLTTVLVSNVPKQWMQKERLTRLFDKLPGGVQGCWFIHDFKELDHMVKDFLYFRDNLERTEIKSLQLGLRKAKKDNFSRSLTLASANLHLRKPQILAPGSHWPKRWVLLPGLCHKVEAYPYLSNKYNYTKFEIKRKQRELIAQDKPRGNMVFIQFKRQIAAYLASQVILSQTLGSMNLVICEVNPKDISWNAVKWQRFHLVFCLRKYLGYFLMVCIIIGWAVPVAFVGLVSQISYLTILVPSLSWLNDLPVFFKGFVSGILPAVALTILTDVMFALIKKLIASTGKFTGCTIQLSLQKWFFWFLFIQVFLVVTVSSGLTAIFHNVINSPASISLLLATNLPKASNFFLNFFIVRGLGCFGSTLLQLQKVIKTLLWYPIVDKTPRAKYSRVTSLNQAQWGTTYPTFTLFGVIGIVYAIIAPLILVFCCLAFCLVLMAFKYSLRYTTDFECVSQSYGKHYPRALMQLYTGVYCLELCLAGLFLLVGSDHGSQICWELGWWMVLVLLMTVMAHVAIWKRFRKLCFYLPLEFDNETCSNSKEQEKEAEQQFKFLPECFRFDPDKSVVWIPKDEFHMSKKTVKKFAHSGIKASDFGCKIDSACQMTVQTKPPDS